MTPPIQAPCKCGRGGWLETVTRYETSFGGQRQVWVVRCAACGRAATGVDEREALAMWNAAMKALWE